MSDVLEKLLGIEKSAAALVTEAETEADKRRTKAREEAQALLDARLAGKAAEIDRALEAEKEKIRVEKEEKRRAHEEELAKSPLDMSSFSRLVSRLIEENQE